MIAICYLLYVTSYMSLAISYLLSLNCYICDLLFDAFYLKLAITCKNLFPFARCCTSRNFLYIHIFDSTFALFMMTCLSNVSSIFTLRSKKMLIKCFYTCLHQIDGISKILLKLIHSKLMEMIHISANGLKLIMFCVKINHDDSKYIISN